MPLRFLHFADVESAYDEPERLARLAGLIEERRDGRTIVTGGGDNTGPSVLSLLTDGCQAVDFFERVRPHTDTLGNHDFDFGIDTARSIIETSPQQWLAANLRRDGDVFAADCGVEPATTVEVDGCRVGMIGVVPETLPAMNRRASTLTASDPGAAIEAWTPRLRERGADRVAVVSHVGDEQALLASLSVDVDVVLGGHSHDPLATVVGDTPVTRPGQGGTHLVEVILGEQPRVHRLPVADAPINEGVREAMDRHLEAAGLAEPVARTDEAIRRTREVEARGESRVGNLVADAYRWRGGADVGLLAARAIRDGEPLVGELTRHDLVSLVPFDDLLVSISIPGERLLWALSELDHRRVPGSRDWYLGHVSGARLEWDDDRRLVAATVAGEPVDPAGTYRVTTSKYFVETDHIFESFDDADVVDCHGPQYEAVVEYARARGVDPSVDGRIDHPTAR